jgi:hypothetical protein
LVAAVALLATAGWQAWQYRNQAQRLAAELASVERAKAALEGQLTSAQAANATLAATLQAQEQRVRELEAAAREGRPPRPGAWSAAGLVDQPRMPEFIEAAREFGFSPGSTRWRTSARELPAQFSRQGSAWESPGALVTGFVPALNLGDLLGQDLWEVTIRVFADAGDKATAAVLLWGFKDDSVVGKDYLLSLRLHQGRWYVAEVQERHHCSRGVTGDLCL